MKFKVGDEVVFINNPPGWGRSLQNSSGIIISEDMPPFSERHYIVRINGNTNSIDYPFSKDNIRKLTKLEKALK